MKEGFKFNAGKLEHLAQPQIHLQLLVNMRFRSVHLHTPDDGTTTNTLATPCQYVFSICTSPPTR
jgi:hypothetical protein